MSHIYGDTDIPTISGLVADENRVGATEFRLVNSCTPLGEKKHQLITASKAFFV